MSTPIKHWMIAGGLAITMTTATVFAHDEDPASRAAERFDYIFTQLNLDDTQRQATIDVMLAQTMSKEDRKAQRETLKDLDQDARQAQMALLKTQRLQALADELNQVLSPNQTAEFIEYLEAHSFHQKKMGKRRSEAKNRP